MANNPRRKPTPHQVLIDTARTLTRLADRYPDFLDAAQDADWPLTAGTPAPGANTYSDPTYAAAQRKRQGEAAIRRTRRIIADVARYTDGLAATLNDWTTTHNRTRDVWCTNPAHGTNHEPRSRDGGSHCRWCADYQRTHGHLPCEHLVDNHTRGIRITTTLINTHHATNPNCKPTRPPSVEPPTTPPTVHLDG